MKFTKSERNLLIGSVVVVIGLLLSGLWFSQRNTAMSTRIGRYQHSYDVNVKGKSTTIKSLGAALELKAGGQFILYGYRGPGTGTRVISGSYHITDDVITFTYPIFPGPSGWKTTRTGRLGKSGFLMTPISFYNGSAVRSNTMRRGPYFKNIGPSTNHRYSKMP
jgi:hypothetical protein